MKVQKTKQGYQIDLTDKEAREVYTEMGFKVGMGNCGHMVHEVMCLLVAQAVEKERQKGKAKKK